MKKKPFFFIVLSAIFAAISLSFPLQILIQYEYPIAELPSALLKLTYLNVIVILLGLSCSWFAFHGHRLLLFFVPIFAIFAAWNNLLVAWYDTYYASHQAFLSGAAVLALPLLLLLPKVWLVLRHPEQVWWSQKKRYPIKVPLKILADQRPFEALTYDLSETGAFVQVDVEKIKKVWETAPYLTLKFSGLSLQASIVRIADAQGMYPAGVGIKFQKLSTVQAKSLKFLCQIS